MINAKSPYVGHGLRVRRRRTLSPLTTYFFLDEGLVLGGELGWVLGLVLAQHYPLRFAFV